MMYPCGVDLENYQLSSAGKAKVCVVIFQFLIVVVDQSLVVAQAFLVSHSYLSHKEEQGL